MLTDAFLGFIFIFSLDFSFQFVSPEGSCRVHSHQHWTNSSQGTDGKIINQLLCSVWEISVSILLTEYLFSIRNNYLFFLSHSFLTFIFYKKQRKDWWSKFKNIYFSDAYIFYKLPFSSIIHSLTDSMTSGTLPSERHVIGILWHICFYRFIGPRRSCWISSIFCNFTSRKHPYYTTL